MDSHQCQSPLHSKMTSWNSLELGTKPFLHRNQVPLILFSHGNFQNSSNDFMQSTSYTWWWNPSFSPTYYGWDPIPGLPSHSDCRIQQCLWSKKVHSELTPGFAPWEGSPSVLQAWSLKGCRLSYCIHVPTMWMEPDWEPSQCCNHSGSGTPHYSGVLFHLGVAFQLFKRVCIWKPKIGWPQGLVSGLC